MELGNWPVKVQLGSTNSKGLPVLFQGSHQGFLLNNQLNLCTAAGAKGMPMAPVWSHSVLLFQPHPSSHPILPILPQRVVVLSPSQCASKFSIRLRIQKPPEETPPEALHLAPQQVKHGLEHPQSSSLVNSTQHSNPTDPWRFHPELQSPGRRLVQQQESPHSLSRHDPPSPNKPRTRRLAVKTGPSWGLEIGMKLEIKERVLKTGGWTDDASRKPTEQPRFRTPQHHQQKQQHHQPDDHHHH